MFSIADYGSMIADTARTDAYADALRRVVTPDSVVVDLGAGTGIFALLACQFGARHVYAIEPDEAIEVARAAAAANGYADRIECLRARSNEVNLPEPAEVIVSDIGGVIPWFGHHLPSIIDARTRFLAKGGVLIPRRDALWMTVLEAPELYHRFAEPWDSRPYRLDLSAARRCTINTWGKGLFNEGQILAPLQRIATVDYAAVTDVGLSVTITWEVARAGTAHGLGAGIDRVLVEGVSFTNAPDSPHRLPLDSIYRTVFFPWSEPVAVAVGDAITVAIRAVLVGDDYVWSWKTTVVEAGPGDHVKAQFRQSSLDAVPLALEHLRHRAADHVPRFTDEGRILLATLELMEQSVPVGEIASSLAARFPARFPSFQAALAFAADQSQRYGA